MPGLRILVVDDHKPMRKCLIEFLQKQEEIGEIKEAANGVEALKYLADESFDVMITDIIMPMMDGYTLLAEMKHMQLPSVPKTIVISALSRDDFVMRAIELGASFYMVKSFEMQHLIHHIRELCCTAVHPQPIQAPPAKLVRTIDERLGSLFLTMGIPAHIKGYQFLRYAVKMVVDQPDVINRITKELYPGIAKHFGTSASKVERAIRHAIEVAWNRGRIETLNFAFGCKVCTPEDKPTNGEFIAMLADKLSLEKTA
ncbi:MAG: sporulation transcription factor Spo0A [Eubacteriales bacterium]|nr:sporulation transcription factor Spo0A [Eubacteriales bacterium]